MALMGFLFGNEKKVFQGTPNLPYMHRKKNTSGEK